MLVLAKLRRRHRRLVDYAGRAHAMFSLQGGGRVLALPANPILCKTMYGVLASRTRKRIWGGGLKDPAAKGVGSTISTELGWAGLARRLARAGWAHLRYHEIRVTCRPARQPGH